MTNQTLPPMTNSIEGSMHLIHNDRPPSRLAALQTLDRLEGRGWVGLEGHWRGLLEREPEAVAHVLGGLLPPVGPAGASLPPPRPQLEGVNGYTSVLKRLEMLQRAVQ
jgi:hypothetical protein